MLGEIRGEVRFKEPLAFHTSLRCGGAADIFVLPQDVDDVRKALMFADKETLPVAVLGGGNNVLVRDRGFRGMVIKLEGCLGRMEFHGEEVTTGCGAGLSTVIREAAALGLGGVECLVGIPATIGGALAMNAGTPDGSIGDFVSAVYFHRRAEAGPGLLRLPDVQLPAGRHPAGRPLHAAPEAAEGDPRRDQGPAQAEEGDPAPGPGLGRLRLEESRLRLCRPPPGEGGPQGEAGRRGGDLGQARQLHREPRGGDLGRHRGAHGARLRARLRPDGDPARAGAPDPRGLSRRR